MKQIHYHALLRNVKSLANSTYLQVTTDKCTKILDRQCSLYKSKREIEFTDDISSAEQFVFSNKDPARTVVVSTSHNEELLVLAGYDCVDGLIPVSTFTRLFERTEEDMPWYSGLVYAAWLIPRVVGYVSHITNWPDCTKYPVQSVICPVFFNDENAEHHAFGYPDWNSATDFEYNQFEKSPVLWEGQTIRFTDETLAVGGIVYTKRTYTISKPAPEPVIEPDSQVQNF